MNTGFLGPAVATVLTACGIETKSEFGTIEHPNNTVATVLTACGIETERLLDLTTKDILKGCNSTYRLRY